MDSYLDALRKYGDFRGRANRTEFWMFMLFSLIITVAIRFVESLVGSAGMIELLYGLAVFIPSIAVGARRLHDTGRSGWWQLLIFIPLIGFLVLIAWFAEDRHQVADQYTKITKISPAAKKQMKGLGVSLVQNYQGRLINVGFGRGSALSDGDLPTLVPLGLHELYLSRTDISDESILQFAGMDQLRVLDVSSTNLSRRGKKELSDLLPQVTIIG
jgi:uncharacterized membrane protein YhaH (DUF805 family)